MKKSALYCLCIFLCSYAQTGFGMRLDLRAKVQQREPIDLFDMIGEMSRISINIKELEEYKEGNSKAAQAQRIRDDITFFKNQSKQNLSLFERFFMWGNTIGFEREIQKISPIKPKEEPKEDSEEDDKAVEDTLIFLWPLILACLTTE